MSERPLEEEEEEEIDEETSIDGLEDVEKLTNEDDESGFVLEDDPKGSGATAWKKKTTRNLKRETTSRGLPQRGNSARKWRS